MFESHKQSVFTVHILCLYLYLILNTVEKLDFWRPGAVLSMRHLPLTKATSYVCAVRQLNCLIAQHQDAGFLMQPKIAVYAKYDEGGAT